MVIKRDKLGRFVKGIIPWSKGKTKETDKRLKKLSEKFKGRIMTWGDKVSETKKRLFKEGNLFNPMKGKKHKEKSIRLMKKNRAGICKGKESPHWKGGISTENDIIRGSAKYKEWRDKIFKRDNFICQNSNCKFCCNKRGGNKIAHHIKSFSKYPKLRFDIDNGLTLCEKFHEKIKDNEEKYIKIFQDKIEKIK